VWHSCQMVARRRFILNLNVGLWRIVAGRKRNCKVL
jgi:hypothetical protein